MTKNKKAASPKGKKHPGGAPTKYTPDLPQKLIEYFDIELELDIYKESKGKKEYVKTIANRIPTIEKFCALNGFVKSTFHEWVKKYPELSNALGIAKQHQQNHLIQHALSGDYNAGFAKFMMMNISDWTESQSHEHDGEIEVHVSQHGKK